jgi:hypothetical protein
MTSAEPKRCVKTTSELESLLVTDLRNLENILFR